MSRRLRKLLPSLLVAGAGLGLIGWGASAAYTDSGTATANVTVGMFQCTLSSTDPNAVISNGGHTVTINMPPIQSSTAGSSYTNVTVKNSGQMPLVVHWTEATAGTLRWQPSGPVGYTLGTPSMATDVALAPGGTQAYTNLGFSWASLSNVDLGTSGSVSYTANCSEAPASGISFVGAADALVAGGTAKKASSLACPAGSPAAGFYPWVSSNAAQWCGNNTFPVASTSGWPTSGSFTVTASGGAATVSYTGLQASPYVAFTGLTNTSSATGSVTPGSNNVTQVLPSTTLTLPSGWQVGDTALVISYGTGKALPAGYTGIMTAFGNYGPSTIGYKVLTSGDGSITVAAGKGVGIAAAVYRGVAGIGSTTWAGNPSTPTACPAFPGGLTVTKGTSWVSCLFAGPSLTLDTISFTGMSTRSGSFVGTHVGVVDTGKGVSTWPGATGGPAGQDDEWAVELESK